MFYLAADDISVFNQQFIERGRYRKQHIAVAGVLQLPIGCFWDFLISRRANGLFWESERLWQCPCEKHGKYSIGNLIIIPRYPGGCRPPGPPRIKAFGPAKKKKTWKLWFDWFWNILLMILVIKKMFFWFWCSCCRAEGLYARGLQGAAAPQVPGYDY